jgi:outer membrane protein, multidrug efflux system
MKLQSIFILLLAVLVLNACNLVKQLPPPEASLPTSFRNAVPATDSAGIAHIEWKQFFRNTGLLQLIDSAIVHNNDMQTALKNIEAAQLTAKQSRLGYLPEARLQVNGSINRPSDNSLNGLSLSQFLGKSYVEDYTAGAVLSWEADIWGKVKNQKKKALAAYLQTGAVKKTIQTNLVSMLANGYYNLLMLDAQIEIAKRNLALNDSTLAIIRLQYEAGQVTALAIQQASAQRMVAMQFIPALQQAVTLQENLLSVLSGVLPAAIPRCGSINDDAFTATLTAGIPAALLENRPDVKTSEWQVTIAGANMSIAKAAMYPSLSITAGGGINSFTASNWLNIPASLFGTVTGGLVQPLFQRRQLKTQYQLASIDREKAVLQFRQNVLTAVGEVADALVKLEKLNARQLIAAEMVDTLEQAIGNAGMLFKNGMASYLEVITAQGNALQGELELATIKKEQLSAAVELYRAAGGGWK